MATSWSVFPRLYAEMTTLKVIKMLALFFVTEGQELIENKRFVASVLLYAITAIASWPDVLLEKRNICFF